MHLCMWSWQSKPYNDIQKSMTPYPHNINSEKNQQHHTEKIQWKTEKVAQRQNTDVRELKQKGDRKQTLANKCENCKFTELHLNNMVILNTSWKQNT